LVTSNDCGGTSTFAREFPDGDCNSLFDEVVFPVTPKKFPVTLSAEFGRKLLTFQLYRP